MQFSVGNASNATAEIAAADDFPLVRMMTPSVAMSAALIATRGKRGHHSPLATLSAAQFIDATKPEPIRMDLDTSMILVLRLLLLLRW